MNRTTEYDPRTEVHTPVHLGAQEVPAPHTEPHTDEHIPFLLLLALIVGASAVAAVAMAASSFTLAELGTAIGWKEWGGWLAWSLPVSVDLLAAVAGVAWLSKGVAEQARRLARTITLIAVATSVLLNAVSHLVQSGSVKVGPWLVIAVSTVPPIVAAVGLHLVVTVVRTAGRRTAAPAPGRRGRKRRRAERQQVVQAQVKPVTLPTQQARPEPVSVAPAAAAPAPAEPVVEWEPVTAPAAEEPVEVWPVPVQEPAPVEQPAAVPAQLQLVESSGWQVRTPVHTGADQQVDAEDDDDDAVDAAARADRDQLIVRAAAEGTSQREIARKVGCSATTVRNVLARHAAAQEVA
ncbi:hypothetical protein GCM10009760_62610 [Kitasatospora kazusensis]|uniref:Homeodomain-like domain-containing protein n=1 Tax=Kitasatospora kazusensis TaxID=407974 RepID=A0ABP4KBB7_9ACTN